MEALPHDPEQARHPEDDPPLTRLDGVSKLRDNIAAVICGVQLDGRLEEPCSPLCVWCQHQADAVVKHCLMRGNHDE